MKYIIIIITIFSVTATNAQVTQPPFYDTCQYLQPLQGEWMNVNGADTIKIYLRTPGDNSYHHQPMVPFVAIRISVMTYYSIKIYT